MNTYLAAIGDVNDPITWSGIPYYFLQSAKVDGLIDRGLPLSADGWRWQLRRYAWNLARVAGGDHYGGYQYSPRFLERLWAPWRREISGGALINCFQLLPPSLVADATVEKWFFIDQTLVQLFDFYGDRARIGRRIAREALERERLGYHAAAGIIAHSQWAADSARRDYEVPAERVHVAVPGANFDRADYAEWEVEEQQRCAQPLEPGPLRLVMVGKYWRRKGLDRLLGALRIARQRGSHIELRVIGCPRDSLPRELRGVEGVEWFGFLDKRHESRRFLRAVAECDLGCLLSRAEAGGMAFREYHALGLPVLGTSVGGAPEHMIAEASIAVPADAGDERIAETLLDLQKDATEFARLREAAWRHHRSALWDKTVQQIRQIMKRDENCRSGTKATVG